MRTQTTAILLPIIMLIGFIVPGVANLHAQDRTPQVARQPQPVASSEQDIKLVYEGAAVSQSLRTSEETFKRLAVSRIRATFAAFGTRVMNIDARAGLDVAGMRMTVEQSVVRIEPVTIRIHGSVSVDTELGPQQSSFDQTGSIQFEAVPYAENQVLQGRLQLNQQGRMFAGRWKAEPRGEDRYLLSVGVHSPNEGANVAEQLNSLEQGLYLTTPQWDLKLISEEGGTPLRRDSVEPPPIPPPDPDDAFGDSAGTRLRDDVGQFVGQFRSQNSDLPPHALEVGILVGVTMLCDGASVADALAAATAAAQQSLEPVQVNPQRGLVTVQSPPATPGAQILSGENAHHWLYQNGYLSKDKVPLAPFNEFRSQMLSRGADPGDTLLGIGGDWDPSDPSKPLGYVTIIVRDRPGADQRDGQQTEPPADESPANDSGSGQGTQLTPAEIDHIVDWGVKHNRPPEDIKRDLREANESAGGSGDIPTDVSATSTPLGPVTATGAEVAEYQDIVRRIDELQLEKADLRQQANQLQQRAQTLYTLNMNVIGRWLAGVEDLTAEHSRLEKRLAAIDKKYARPSVWDYPDTVAWREAVDRWNRSPEATGQISPEHQREIGAAHHDFVTAIENKTTDKPLSAEGTSWLNRHIANLNEVERQHQEVLSSYRQKHAEFEELNARRNQFEQRALQ